MSVDIMYLIFMEIFILLLLIETDGLVQTILNTQLVIHNETLVKSFVHLLRRIDGKLPYDYILYVRDVTKKSDCIFEDSIVAVNKPIIIVSELINPSLLRGQHSSNFLLITCSMRYLNRSSIFNTVYQYVPHIIWLAAQKTEAVVKGNMLKLCSHIHASGYFQNWMITPHPLGGELKYFNCDFQRNLRSNVHEGFFTNPFLNMQGYKIATEADQLPPRSILFYDDFGQLKLTGFVANYLITFAERYNATLRVVPPADMGVTVHYTRLANRTFEGILDIAAVAARFKVDTFTESYSYPVELMEYCFMIPLPHIRPAYHVFFDIIEAEAMLIIFIYFIIIAILLNIAQGNGVKRLKVSNVVLNDKSIRGLLGQSFVMPRKPSWFLKYILFLLCYSSILLCTSYQAYLQSHLVHPSLEKRMETFDDIRKNKFKILIDEQESFYMSPDLRERQHDLFITVKNFYRFLKLRDSMDTRYIFPVSRTRWSVFHERQKLFQRKLFYYSSKLCLNPLVLLSFPLGAGLPYKTQFNQHLLDVRDVGLLDCWLGQNFLTMVRLKLLSFKDLSIVDEYGPALDLNDLIWIWLLYVICVSLSILVFIGELLLHKTKRK